MPRGNPNWKKGMASPNAKGRPASLALVHIDKALAAHGRDWEYIFSLILECATGVQADGTPSITFAMANARDKLRALELVIDRRFGKPKESIDVTTTEHRPNPKKLDLAGLSDAQVHELNDLADRLVDDAELVEDDE